MDKRVLIVDDDEFLRDIYEEVLKGEGLIVETAQDGEEGLAKIQTGEYDVVLLDVMMPKLDGLGVITKLKEHPPAKMPAIIFLTNLTNDPAIQTAVANGTHSYLTKANITPDQVVAEVKKYL